MQYLLLIYNAESASPKPGTDEFGKLLAGYTSFTEEVQNKEVMLGSNALQPLSTATTVQVRNGKTECVDGPFAETKEALGGYYLLDVETLDEAIEYAAKIPTAEFGSIEIRPIMVWDQ